VALVRTGFIPLPPGPKPGFDHADAYRDGSGTCRLYVAHTGADTVEVIDCTTSTFLHSLPDHPGVASALIDSDQDLLFTFDREASQVGVYRCSDEALLGVGSALGLLQQSPVLLRRGGMPEVMQAHAPETELPAQPAEGQRQPVWSPRPAAVGFRREDERVRA